MSSEEDDYMSDAFLQGSLQNDIRPGLVFNRSVKRSYELSRKREKEVEDAKAKKKCLSVAESEKREEGLDKPICSNNKGFEMLKKMGFNPGTGLGLKGQGRAEPIRIEIKNNKEGLGRKEALKELIEKKRMLWKESKKSTPSVVDFRASLAAKNKEKGVARDLAKSQKTCYMLDSKENIAEPDESWFWPKSFVKDEEVENDSDSDEPDDELSLEDKLELITVYLRTNYFYCIWCGVKYENEDDMATCPGSTKDDH